MNRCFSKEATQMANGHMKRRSTSLSISEMQIRTQRGTTAHWSERLRLTNSGNSRRWRGAGEAGSLVHCWWEYKFVQPL